ncbi:MAG: AAA family ATPase [Parcubacteria group bacterium]|nr:AAA family ATPase [Parcubacteria group bacterium]
MLLKRLELSGFKSFARTTTFSFTTPVTAVVGPNGSGKSNIAEAMRFVLGEQSMKSLRSKRGEDLIWNGSPSVARANRGSVTVTFDNSARQFALDFDEVELERVIYRDSTSQYLINGTAVRLRDIIELLSSVHIGASSHHIISQGEADHILSASIAERRAMIEDALGLKIYQYKRAESERKLQKTRENIAHAGSLRKEISPHLKFLEKQVEKIRRAEQLRNEFREEYRAYAAGESAYLAHSRQTLDADREAPRSELRALDADILRAEQQRVRLEKQTSASGTAPVSEKDILTAQAEKDELAREIGRLEGMLLVVSREKSEDGAARESFVTLPLDAFSGFKTSLLDFLSRALEAEDRAAIQGAVERARDALLRFWDDHVGGAREQTALREAEEKRRTQKERDELSARKAALLRDYERAAARETSLRAAHERALFERAQGADELRGAERALTELKMRQSELTMRQEVFSLREEKLAGEEAAFKEVERDAILLLGRDAADFKGTGGEFDASVPRSEQEKRKRALERLRIKVEELGSGGNDVMKEYEEVAERDRYLARELEDLEKSAESLSGLIAELGKKIELEFKEGVKKINTEFQKLFTLMFGGGKAALTIVLPPPKRRRKKDELAELEEGGGEVFPEEEPEGEREEGIDILVSIPSKHIRGLEVLSGGERSLTSIALIFAITQVNPPPFLFLDETDAALDESNSRKFGDLITTLARKTQFIIITHNRETMTRAGVLYGVTAGADGISRTLSVKLEEAVGIAE